MKPRFGAMNNLAGAAGALYNMYGRYKKSKSKPKSQIKLKKNISYTQPKRRRPGRVSHSNTAQPVEVFKHGKKPYVNKKFIQAVRQAITSTDTLQRVASTASLSNIGHCKYVQSPVLLGVDAIHQIALHLPTTNDTNRFTVKDSLLDVSLTNQSVGVACMRVYECEFRHDVPYTGSYLTPEAILNRGWIDAGYSGNSTDITSTVFTSPAFTTWFKVITVRKYELNAGETKHLILKDSSPFTLTKERYAVGGTAFSIQGFRRRSKFFIFQQWGQVVNDLTDTSIVSTDATKIDFVYTQRYNYTWCDDITNNVYKEGSLGNVITARFVNEASGAVTTDAQA